MIIFILFILGFILAGTFVIEIVTRQKMWRKIKFPLYLILILSCINILINFTPESFSEIFKKYVLILFYFSFVYGGIKLSEIIIIDYLVQKKKNIHIPVILKDIILIVLYVVTFFTILNQVLGINLTPLLATSALLTVVAGFALQDTLGNLFAGLALSIEKPFQRDDWVIVGGKIGKVTEMSWRAVKIKTFENDYLIIPNNVVSREQIINFSRPTTLHARLLNIGVSYSIPPTKVKNTILEAVHNAKGILKEPPAIVRLINYGDFSITYQLQFWIDDFSQYREIEDGVMTLIWYYFKRRSVEIPFPIRNIYMHHVTTSEEEKIEEEIRRKEKIINKIDFLKPLYDEEIFNLARKAKIYIFKAGENIIREGEKGDSMYIIQKGRAEILVKDESGLEHTISNLGPLDYFGEMSLMTGENRAATVRTIEDSELICIGKGDVLEIISVHPSIAATFSEIIAKRQLEMKIKKEERKREEMAAMEKEISSNILERIFSFFKISREKT